MSQHGSPENDERDVEIARLRAENERLRASPPPAPPAPSSSPYRTDPRIFDGRTHDASAPPPPMYAAPNLTGYYVAPPGDPNHYRAPNYGAAPQHAHYYAAPGYGWTHHADHLNPGAPRYPNWPHPPPVLRPLAPEGNVPESASSYRADPRMYDGMTHDASAPPSATVHKSISRRRRLRGHLTHWLLHTGRRCTHTTPSRRSTMDNRRRCSGPSRLPARRRSGGAIGTRAATLRSPRTSRRCPCASSAAGATVGGSTRGAALL